MRVLHVYRTYFPDTQGGLEEAIRQICASTREHGVESRVFMLSRNPDPPIVKLPEAQVHRFPLNFEIASCGFSLTSVRAFSRLVAWADVIHYHFPWPFADLLHLLTKVKKPALLTYHSDVVRQRGLLRFYRPFMKYFLSKVQRIVATSPNYLATSPVLNQIRDRVSVIPIGLNQDSYPTVSKIELDNLRQQVGSNFFLFVGVLRYYKGLHILLKAAKNADFKVVIVGAGPIEAELKEQAETLGLDNVKFLGFVSDETKVALYHLARTVVFPSHLRAEAFGVTLVEGAMFSKPLISTELGTGMSYINIHNETGLVVPPSNPGALRQAMDLLHNDDELVRRMGKSAYNRYRKLFTGEHMGKQYYQVYTELAEITE